MHEGIGGKSALISMDDIPVFVKKVPLTDLEKLPHNFMSTENLFDLLLSYQYGVGSAGFGAWRELATQGTCAHRSPNNEPQDQFSENPVKSRVLDMRTLTTDVCI